MVFEFGFIFWFVVGGVEVVDATFKAGIHDGEVLVGKGDVDAKDRLMFFHELDEFRDVIGIDLCCFDGDVEAVFDRFGDIIAL